MRHVLAIDQGATGSTCLVVGQDGSVAGRGYREITQHFPRPGWVEHDAAEIFARTIFNVPRAMLPSVRPSSGDFGVASAEHLGVEIPICGVAGDQQAALFGKGCWRAGEAKNTYGARAFLLLNTGAIRAVPSDGLLTTVARDGSG